MGDVCLERELQLTDVTDGDGVRTSWGLDNGTERTRLAILTIDPHFCRCIVGARPELDVGVERAAFSLHVDLNLLNARIAIRPGSQGATLNPDHRGVRAWSLFVSDAWPLAHDWLLGTLLRLHGQLQHGDRSFRLGPDAW
jgi:hypothetical protein